MENYESLGVIGEGTYGVVMKARHKETGQVVAIKKFKESDEDEQVRKTSLREVRVLKQLRHDNVITLLEVFRRKGKLYLVFEYVEKTILEVLEKKPNGLDEQDVRKYTYQLLRGVEYCHANNIIHRDVKPENILISRNGALKICDFGFARPMSVGGKYTDYVATRWYRCPELLVGDVEYGKGVDVWAIGCIFAEISNGIPLFAGESDPDQLAHVIRCNGKLTNRHIQIFRRNPLYAAVELPPVPPELESLDSRFPNVPKNWLNFLKGCLRNDPDQRETCASLIGYPYFTERNWRAEYDAELKMIMDKENRSNALKRPSAEPATAPTSTNRPPEIINGHYPGEREAVSSYPPPLTKKESPTIPGYQVPVTQSVWSQFLQQQSSSSQDSGNDGTTTAALFPGLKSHPTVAPPLSSTNNKSTFLPNPQTAQTGMKPVTSTGNTFAHSYLTTYSNSEQLVVTNSKHATPPAPAYALGLSTKKVAQGSPTASGTTLPTLGTASSSIGGLSINPSPSASSSWTLPATSPSSQMPSSSQGLSTSGTAASQLAYKKKPGKRNVLSTLSLTAFGGQQAFGVDSQPAPTTGGNGFMMLHGQGHSLDHPPSNSRRGSKPWG